MRKFYIYFFSLLCTLILISCKREKGRPKLYSVFTNHHDLRSIQKKKKLIVLFEKSKTSFFKIGDKKMGFEYELLKAFAKEINVELVVKIIHKDQKIEKELIDNKCDMVACSYTVTKKRKEKIGFTMPYIKTPQVLIQRLPSKDTIVKYIKEPTELNNKEVHVRLNSSYYERLQHLSHEIGEPIRIVNINRWISPEECMEQVEKGVFSYTVVDRHIAVANNYYFKKLDHSLVLGINQNIAFGIRKDAEKLKEKFDFWLNEYMHHPHFKFLKNNYFSGKEISTKTFESMFKIRYGKISPYDHFFQNKAKKYNVEWELLAAIIHHESKFMPNLIGAGGAFGLMQFMPATGRKYGVSAFSSPEDQIEAGALKLSKDWEFYSDIKDESQRIKFILAAYNGGSGHLKDARNLAEKHGLNPCVWEENVEVMMCNLSKSEYYNDPVVKSGSTRRKQIGRYVTNVYSKYLMYKYLDQN